MSSILEALRELEGGEAPTTSDAELWTGGPGPLRRAVPAIVLAVCATAAAGGAFLWSRGGTDAPPAVVPPPVVSVLPPAAPAAAPAPAALDADPPRAIVAAKSPAAAPAAAVAMLRPPVRVASARVAADVPRPRPAHQHAAGEPLVDIDSIGYSSVPEKRVVALRVNGGATATLHEGESADGIEVQLIMPGSVYVRHAGQIFAVDAGG